MKLPRVPYKLTKNMSEVIAMRGINYGDMLRDGDLRESTNLSARRYPYLSVRRGRVKDDSHPEAFAMSEWDGKLIVVESAVNAANEDVAHIRYGENLLKNADGNPYELSQSAEKQFAVVGNKLIIFPDKAFFDLAADNLTVRPLADTKTYYGMHFYTDGTLGGGGSRDFSMFPKDEPIIISGCSVESNNKTVILKEYTSNGIKVANMDGTTENVFVDTPDFKETIYVSAYIPNLDYICEYNNRLYGCSNADNTVYVSSLGKPEEFFETNTGDAGSFSVAVGSDGKFTGCTRFGSSVLFWKEDKLHKLLGEYPSEYTLYSYDIDGVQAGSHKSQQVINETLFYLGSQGVYAYGGGIPTLISENFGQRRFKNGVAGRDTDSYYLSAEDKNGNPHLFVYETTAGFWLREDDLRAKDFARAGRDLYVLDRGGIIHKMDSGEADKDVEWMAYFTPFYETMQGRKTYSKLLIRAEIPQGAYIKPEVRYDGGDWKSLPAITGGKDAKNDTVAIPIPINRCDKFELRLSGKGDVAILGMVREFMVRSDK